MRLSIDEVIHFTSFIRRADNEGMLGSIDIYGIDMQKCSSDEGGEDPTQACVRQVTISKNKLTGDHSEFQVQLIPTLSQFTSFT